MADIINIPTKTPTSELFAEEFNQVPISINEVNRKAEEPSHLLSEEYFKINGTGLPPGGTIPKPIVELNLNPDHFEIVNGMVSIKAGLLA